MDETRPSSLSNRIPLLPRLVLWLGIAAMMVMMLWPAPKTETRTRFYFAGNRTHLHAVLSAMSADPKSEANPLILYSSTDLKKVWSEPIETHGNVAQVLAWQEDLVVLFADGGLSLLGPAKQGYRKSPKAGDPKAWRWWLTAAADGDRLMTLGLDAENRPVYCERGPDGWGDVVAVDLNVEWTAKTGPTMAAAVRGEELHVVWPTEPVADTPTGTGSMRRWLTFAWRDPGGKWHGPVQQKEKVRDEKKWIQPTGRMCIAPFGGKLAMVYAETVESGDAAADEAAKPLLLAYAQFTPADGSWHRLGRLELPAEVAKATTTYGFTAFGDGHVLALNNDGDVTLLAMDAETGKLSAMAKPPELNATVTDGESTEGLLPLFLFSLAFMVLMMVIASRGMRRRALHEQVSAGQLPREEAARIVAAQIERLMYLPVLVRRIGAVFVDLVVVSVVSLVIIMQTEFRELLADGRIPSTADTHRVVPILLAVLVGYHIIMELLWQRSLGKMLTKVCVVDLQGRRPAWWRIVLRNLIRPFDLFLFGLVGLSSIIWSRRNQTLGDMAAGTRVVMNRPASGTPNDRDTHIA